MSPSKSRFAALDYVIELLSERGKKHRILGWGSNINQAHECYDAALRDHPHTWVRMRQGRQTIAVRIPEAFVHEPDEQKRH